MSRLRAPLVWIARLVVAGAFRGFEVRGRGEPGPGPRLIVANHFGGLLDVIVVIAALRLMPHVVAKATLFRRMPMRLALRALGVIPVYRRMDGADTTQNVSSFAAVHEVLADGGSVLIFPEGTVTDEQRLRPMRTGAARMVVGAMAGGTSGIEILPVGITYEDKVAARSRVLTEIGEPVLADRAVPALAGEGYIDEENRGAVAGLTAAIGEALGAVSPDYGSLLREAEMMELAEMHVRTTWDDPYRDPPVSYLREVAQRLAHEPPERIGPVLDEAGRYALALSASGLSDDAITPRPGLMDVSRLIARTAVILLVLWPLTLFGIAANVVPVLLTMAAGATVREPVSKGTARLVTAVVAFPVAWAVVIWATQVRGWAIGLVILALAGASLALVVSLQLLIDLIAGVLRWRQVFGRRALLDDLASRRAGVEDALQRLVDPAPPHAVA